MRAGTKIGPGGVAYEERGEGFPILALHGWTPDRRLMTGCMEPCFGADGRAVVPPSSGAALPLGGNSARSYRRIYPDLPFMGESADPDWIRNSDDMLEAIAVLSATPFREVPSSSRANPTEAISPAACFESSVNASKVSS